jgi:hypothetical protein
MKLLTIDEINKLAEKRWEGCHHCDENDKYFWMNGFMMGYLEAKLEDVDDKIKTNQDNISDMLINGYEK